MDDVSYECEYCYKVFTRMDNLGQHLKNRPDSCVKTEQRVKEKLEEKLNVTAEKAKKEGYLEASKIYENKIADLHQSQTETIKEIVSCPPSIRSRKKKLEDIQSRKKIQNFETILETANFDISVIRNCCNALADGDIVMFKRAVIDNTPKEEQCVRIRDFARDKYQYFNGFDWETIPLRLVAEKFMDQLYAQYKKIILGEKHKEIDELDKKYPRWDPKYTDYNNKTFNEITDRYMDASYHYAALGACTDDLKASIMAGIKALLTPDGEKKKE